MLLGLKGECSLLCIVYELSCAFHWRGAAFVSTRKGIKRQ